MHWRGPEKLRDRWQWTACLSGRETSDVCIGGDLEEQILQEASGDTYIYDDRRVRTAQSSFDNEPHLLISLLSTSMYFFMSSTSAGSFALKTVKGDTGAPSST